MGRWGDGERGDFSSPGLKSVYHASVVLLTAVERGVLADVLVDEISPS